MRLHSNSSPLQSPADQPSAALVTLGLLLILVLRLGLGDFPTPIADEGGWPLSVRLWVTQGIRTPDYYVAPGYHWLQGIPFALFGPTLRVARLTSEVVGLVGLALFSGIVRQLQLTRVAAFWALLILGTSYQAILVDRRGLMEPLQVLWMLILVFVFLRPATRASLIGLAVSVAGLLLTKSSAVFLIPALALAPFWEKPIASNGQRSKLVALGAGMLIAGVVFGALYLTDPITFAKGWFPTLSLEPVPRSRFFIGFGRFGFDPITAFGTIRQITLTEPLLVAYGLAGMLKGLLERRQAVMVVWLLFGSMFLLIQALVLDNHLAVIIPPLAFLTAWFLGDLRTTASAVGVGRLRMTWPSLCLLGQVLYSTLRLAGAAVTTVDPAAEAVRWLRARVGRNDVVAASSVVLMQLDATPVTFFRFPPPYLPTPQGIHQPPPINWMVLDHAEWGGYMRKYDVTEADSAAAFSSCCDTVFSSPGGVVFRVRE